MEQSGTRTILCTHKTFQSHWLQRLVDIDLYQPVSENNVVPHLLLLNDGQDLCRMPFETLLEPLTSTRKIVPLVCVGIHAGAERLQEYGIGAGADYAGRGAKAGLHQQFVLAELLPFVQQLLGVQRFASVGYAGFSLGGLSAIDAVWQHPELFSISGVFSGSLWWRSHPLGNGYDDQQHRMIHAAVRNGAYRETQRYYFTTGSLDETADRNGNGVIDSIDDTLDLVQELRNKISNPEQNLCYVNYEGGRHDVATWARALPSFLQWGWGK